MHRNVTLCAIDHEKGFRDNAGQLDGVAAVLGVEVLELDEHRSREPLDALPRRCELKAFRVALEAPAALLVPPGLAHC